jgi:hypothetical protein
LAFRNYSNSFRCNASHYHARAPCHADPIAAKARIAQATKDGIRLGADAYGYPRAFTYAPEPRDLDGLNRGAVLDPTAGGGSIPFEAVRLDLDTYANDLNPVAALILKGTVEFPEKFGAALTARYRDSTPDFTLMNSVRNRVPVPVHRDPRLSHLQFYFGLIGDGAEPSMRPFVIAGRNHVHIVYGQNEKPGPCRAFNFEPGALRTNHLGRD